MDFGYDQNTSEYAAERCSTVEAAIDWISQQEQLPVANEAEVVAVDLGRQGRTSFSDAMGTSSSNGSATWSVGKDDKTLPSAPPLF